MAGLAAQLIVCGTQDRIQPTWRLSPACHLRECSQTSFGRINIAAERRNVEEHRSHHNQTRHDRSGLSPLLARSARATGLAHQKSASKLCFLTTPEHVVIEGPPLGRDTPVVKAVYLLLRRAGMTAAEFQDYWRSGYAPQIPRDASILRYVQCHPACETYVESTPRYDGVAEMTCADYTVFEKYWTRAHVQDIFAHDAPRFLDAANCTAFLADETRVLSLCVPGVK